jgi:carboxyvinyl-carboxyphosphonate phosphorylmutase
VFDPLSARLAAAQGWRLAKLSGSILKAAGLGLPDAVAVVGASELADLTRRIVRVADLPVIVDADDGGGSALAVRRCVEELELAGAAGIEIEDVAPSPSYGPGGERRASFVATADIHLAQLGAAAAARRDPETVIVARTHALRALPLDQALARIARFADAGAEALMLPGLPRGVEDLRAVRQATTLPLCVLGLPREVAADADLARSLNVAVRHLGLGAYGAAVNAMAQALGRLQRDEELDPAWTAPEALLRTVDGTDDLAAWEDAHRVPHAIEGPGAGLAAYLGGDHGR